MAKRTKTKGISVLAELKKVKARKLASRVHKLYLSDDPANFLNLRQPSMKERAIIKQESLFMFMGNLDKEGNVDTKLVIDVVTRLLLPMLLLDENKNPVDITAEDATYILFRDDADLSLLVLVNGVTEFLKKHVHNVKDVPADIEKGVHDGETISPK